MDSKGLGYWMRKNRGWASATASEGEAWPKATHVHCHWCCHTFDGIPIPLPTAHDDRTDVFKVTGVFCSWSCAKAYNIYSSASNWGERSELLYLLYKRTVPPGERNPGGIPVALPRTHLKMFGGKLDIDEFRAMSGSAMCERSIFAKIDCAKVGFMDPSATQSGPAAPLPPQAPLKPLTFENLPAGKNETLKLRRSKPLPTKTSNILEKVLGLKSTATSEQGPK